MTQVTGQRGPPATTPSSATAVTPGTSSSPSRGGSCRSVTGPGHIELRRDALFHAVQVQVSVPLCAREHCCHPRHPRSHGSARQPKARRQKLYANGIDGAQNVSATSPRLDVEAAAHLPGQGLSDPTTQPRALWSRCHIVPNPVMLDKHSILVGFPVERPPPPCLPDCRETHTSSHVISSLKISPRRTAREAGNKCDCASTVNETGERTRRPSIVGDGREVAAEPARGRRPEAAAAESETSQSRTAQHCRSWGHFESLRRWRLLSADPVQCVLLEMSIQGRESHRAGSIPVPVPVEPRYR